MAKPRRHPLILASASERRRRILAELGVEFRVVVTQAEEEEGAVPPDTACRVNALRKCEACRARHPDSGIVAADTVIEFEGRAMHKPADLAEAFRFFRALSGRTHRVLTATALFSPNTNRTETRTDISRVTFQTLGDEQIGAYFRHVNPLDKAGGYDIGQHADLIIESFEGSATNIEGLPVETVRPWLVREGWLVPNGA